MCVCDWGITSVLYQRDKCGDVRITICCKMKSRAFAMSAFLHEI